MDQALQTDRRHDERAFSLIELMAVLVVILVLAGIAVSMANYAQRKAAISRTKAEMAVLETALEAYRLDTGMYPTSGLARPTGLAVAYTNSWLLYQQLASAPKSYIQFKPDQISDRDGLLYSIVDSFGSAYGYYCVRPVTNAQINKLSFDLWSFGPDRRSSTASEKQDDITNWQ